LSSGADEIWREPVRGGYRDPWLLTRPGAERLEAFRDGSSPRPPLARLTGAMPTGFGDGTAEACMPATAWLANDAGLLGGGTLAILADIAFGVALETRLPAGVPFTTAELSLTFVRPAHPGTSLVASGQSIHVGRSMGLIEAFVCDSRDETLLAHGTSRLSILPRIDDGLTAAPGEPFVHPPQPGPDPYERIPPPDAVLPQGVWDELSGLEIARRHIAGELPPPAVHRLTGIAPTEVGEGTATVRMPATEWLNSPARRLQGGTIVMLADTAMTIAVLTTAPAGTAIAALDLKANFLRPVIGDGRDLTARAVVEHTGRTLAISRTRIENADGKPVMLATGTAMYLPGRPASLGADTELDGAAGD
jgi:uncharacterized protein (TIGR00369 family)